ncbi:MAG: heavy metal translocating P-type ATPase metal-binding domain-containing protein, partial [Elsteraceae bacterium]
MTSTLLQRPLTASGCQHCGQPLTTSGGADFCCAGCAAAYDMIKGLGLGRYYDARVIDATQRPLRPESAPGESAREASQLDRFIQQNKDGNFRLDLMVEGLQCGACVWLIEAALAKTPDLVEGRVNMSTRRLRLVWRGERSHGATLVRQIEMLGYRLAPFDLSTLKAADDKLGQQLTRALAVSGFAAGNIMMLSIGIWSGGGEIGPATRDL